MNSCSNKQVVYVLAISKNTQSGTNVSGGVRLEIQSIFFVPYSLHNLCQQNNIIFNIMAFPEKKIIH